MNEAGSRDPVTDVEAQIAAEHREIREVGRQIEASAELGALLELCDHFRSLLVAHFSTEEAHDGFFDMVRAMAPRQLAKLSHLEKEHTTLLAEIDRIGASARACLEGPVAAILAEARTLVRRLRSHESAEDSLLLDTLYDDVGQGD